MFLGLADLFKNYHVLFKTSIFWMYMAALIVDLISGNIRAWVQHDIDSTVGVKGSLKHFALFAFVTIFLPSLVMYTGDIIMAQGVLVYFIYQYLISIIENFGLMGVSFPPELADRFRRLGNHEEDDEE